MANLAVAITEKNTESANLAKIDQKIEVTIFPVSDVDRAKEFYLKLGWRLDADFNFPSFRVVQVTPHGSACSLQFGMNLTAAAPGSGKGYIIVSDVVAARTALIASGVQVGEFFHLGQNGVAPGLDPERGTYRSRAEFKDPDGNSWVLQEITSRLPGRGFSNLDVATMTDLLRETEQHHGQYEPTAPKHHWSGWYGAYIVARQEGKTPEEAAEAGKLQIEGAH